MNPIELPIRKSSRHVRTALHPEGDPRVQLKIEPTHDTGSLTPIPATQVMQPTDPIHTELLTVWRHVLASPDLGVDTTFSDAGGTSLAAMQLLNAIHERTGYRLQPRTLVTAPSVREQAALIERMRHAVTDSQELIAIPVQSGGNRPPQFIIPGYGDTLVSIHQLAQAMGSDRPFYILDPASFDPVGKHYESLHQLAQAMVREIRRIRPQGPYHICGHSMGAHLVWEIACQLHDAGVAQGAVVLLDSNAPGYPPKVLRPLRWVMKLVDAARHGPRQLAKLFQQRWQLGFRDLFNLPPLVFDAQEKEQLGEIAEQLERQWMATWRLCAADTPRSYPGRVHLVRASIRKAEVGARDEDPMLGWGRFAQEPIQVLAIDSDHWDILEVRHARELAALLRQAILN